MRTVSESFDLRTVEDCLERMRSGISAAVTTEAALMKAKAVRMTALWREAQQHAEGDVGKLDARIRALEAGFKEDVGREQLKMEARAAWIDNAYHSAKASLARRMQEAKDRRIGHVQGEIMRRREARRQESEQAAARHRAFQEELAADRVTRRDLRAALLSSFRTFRPVIEAWFSGKGGKFPEIGEAVTPEETRATLLDRLAAARIAADEARRFVPAMVFRWLPLWLLAVATTSYHLWHALRAGGPGLPAAFPALAISLGVLLLLWSLALLSSLPLIRRAAAILAEARELEKAAEEQSAARLAELNAVIEHDQAEESRSLGATFRETDEEWRTHMAEGQRKLDEQVARLPFVLQRLHRKRMDGIETARELAISRAHEDADTWTRDFAAGQNEIKAAIDAETDAALGEAAETWRREVLPCVAWLEQMGDDALAEFPEWTAEVCSNWEPPADVSSTVRIGRIEVNAAGLAGKMPGDARFALPSGGRLTAPLALGFPDYASLLIESEGGDDGAATRALSSISLRLLASHPPGRATFVFIDPVGLGKDFAGLMHLADYEETLITNRIWTQGAHIEERLAEINEHIEKVIQMYLRNEFADITEYNKQAGMIAEKNRFVVISGFPAGFSDTAAKRLRSIASSGARCGVHLLVQRDARVPSSDPALDDELRRNCVRLSLRKGVFHLVGAPAGTEVVVPDPPPSHEDAMALIHRIGRASVDSNRVQVPFSQIAPPEGEMWTSLTSEELQVPIGRTGARKLQMLRIGKGTRQHMLVAGKTGSGKSTLFHVIITNLALWCSPQQVEFYLVDFKKGVEFKCYATRHLPHARVIAIESDREFALSVLQRVDAELKRRGELFRRAGAQDLAGYKRSGVNETMPRTLLLIDEFQEFFIEDDAVAQEASLLLDRIVRQGRAFGIHVILGSQTLGGAYTLARATLGQMVIRVALQCNETDAHLIMDDDNPAPRLLSRPGEGIYNDQAGALAANSPFQIVWLPEEERDALLDKISARAASAGKMPSPPIIFEGNAPADVRDNPELNALIHSRPVIRPPAGRAWLGAPNSIKGPTEAVFRRQSGSHLLVVGQAAERSLSLLAVSLVSLASQFPPGQAEFVVLDPHAADPDGDNVFHKLRTLLPGRIKTGGPAELPELMSGLGAELAARLPTSGRDASEVFLIVHDLQRFKALRGDDGFAFSLDDDVSNSASPAKFFSDLLDEGGPCGMHVLATADIWNNVSRWIPRKLMAAFEMRVLFQMSANDSANLIDSQAATTLGLHRALFYNESHSSLETFRPYAMPDAEWLESAAART